MGLMLPSSPGFSRFESNLDAAVTANIGTPVSHGAVAHTKSAYATLIASTAFDSYFCVVSVCNNLVGDGNSSTLLDIAIGAAASETVIIPDLMAGFVTVLTTTPGARHYMFPLYIPAGSRISGRTQSVRTSGDVSVLVELYGGPRVPAGWWCGQQVVALGANAANSAGVKVTPGTSAEGTAVSLGTTAQDWECMVLGVQGHPDDVSWASGAAWIDLGIDSSSTEWIESNRYMISVSSGEAVGCGGYAWWPMFRHIKSGSEIMIRALGGGTPDPFSAAVYGVI